MRTLKLTLVAAVVSLLGIQGASAQGLYLGVHGGVNLTHEGEVGGVVDLSYDPGPVAGATLGYRISPNLRAEGEATYRENDFDELDTPFGTFSVTGDISSWAFMGNVFYDFWTGSNWTPYVGAGLGVAIVEWDEPGFEDDDTVFAFQLGAGVAFDFTPNLALTLDYRFFGTEEPEFAGVDVEYLNSSFMAGLRVSF